MSADATVPAALVSLRDAVTMWALGYEGSSSSILAAADALAAGIDTPALRELAGLPLETSWWTTRDLLQETFSQLGLEFPDQGTASTRLCGLRIMCSRFLKGDITAEGLTAWAHSVVGHDFGNELADDIVLLDDTDDEMPERPADWAPRVRRAALALLASG